MIELMIKHNKTQLQIMKPAPIAIVPKITKDNDQITNYLKIAREVGFVPPKLRYEKSLIELEEIKQTLSKNNIPIYNLDEVNVFLNSKLKRKEKIILTPLREIDLKRDDWPPHGFKLFRDRKNQLIHHHPQLQVYNDFVPIEILQRVKTVENIIALKKMFYVATIANDPDPFLILRIRLSKYQFLCIGFWDEPGFRLKQ